MSSLSISNLSFLSDVAQIDDQLLNQINGGVTATGPKGLAKSAEDPTKAIYGIDKQIGNGKAAFFKKEPNKNWVEFTPESNNDDARGKVFRL
ncbi:MAG: hypothetical protein Tsb0014_16590 [Pleurocapsa sp.]